MTTVCACEKTVVMVKQPGHLTSMKKDRGAGTSIYGDVLVYEFVRGGVGGVRVERVKDGILGRGQGAWSGEEEWKRTYLKFMLTQLRLRRRIEKIDCENLLCRTVSHCCVSTCHRLSHHRTSPRTCVPSLRLCKLVNVCLGGIVGARRRYDGDEELDLMLVCCVDGEVRRKLDVV